MKKLLLVVLLVACAFASRSQGRVTTAKEYNYLVTGNYEANMPGHHLVKSSVYVTDQNLGVSIWQLYRDGASTSCALVIIYYKDNKPLKYIAIPDIKSPATMLADYKKRLNNLQKDGNALTLVSYALGQFAVSE